MKVERMIKTVDAEGFVRIALPHFSHQQVEIIVKTVETQLPNESLNLALLQEQSGFAQTVLADAAEDVWNAL